MNDHVENELPQEFLERFEQGKRLLVAGIEACTTPMELATYLFEKWGLEARGSSLSKKLGVKPVLAVVATNQTGDEYLKPFDPFSCLEAGEWVSVEDAFSRLEHQFTAAERWQLDHSLRYATTFQRGLNDRSDWRFRRLYTLFDRDRGALWQPPTSDAEEAG